MALKDWHGWQLGILWAFGIGITWLVSRLGVAAVDGDAAAGSGQVTAGGAPLWTTAVTVLIISILTFVTVRWVRGRILDE